MYLSKYMSFIVILIIPKVDLTYINQMTNAMKLLRVWEILFDK